MPNILQINDIKHIDYIPVSVSECIISDRHFSLTNDIGGQLRPFVCIGPATSTNIASYRRVKSVKYSNWHNFQNKPSFATVAVSAKNCTPSATITLIRSSSIGQLNHCFAIVTIAGSNSTPVICAYKCKKHTKNGSDTWGSLRWRYDISEPPPIPITASRIEIDDLQLKSIDVLSANAVSMVEWWSQVSVSKSIDGVVSFFDSENTTKNTFVNELSIFI